MVTRLIPRARSLPVRPSAHNARALPHISGAVNLAHEPRRRRRYESSSRGEKDFLRSTLLCSHCLGSVSATEERAYTRLTLGTTRAIASLRKFATTPRVLCAFACPFRPCTRRPFSARRETIAAKVTNIDVYFGEFRRIDQK